MQVKKFEASTVIEALQQVKKVLGPDAIVLSTQENKRSVAGAKKFVVVAAVSELQLRKKELAEKQMADFYKDRVQSQPAIKQKMFIENVYRGIEKKHESRNRKITSTPYIDIDDSDGGETSSPALTAAPQPTTSNLSRVRQAAQEAFKSSMTSDFFSKPKLADSEELLPDDVLKVLTQKPPRQKVLSEPVLHMLTRLKNCGVNTDIIEKMKHQCLQELGAGTERKALVDSWFAKLILRNIPVIDKRTSDKVEVFVGPHGAGKTSSLVKVATQYVMQEQQRVAIVTTDLNKVGGVEQLRVYSRILNAPVVVVRDIGELDQKIEDLQGFDKILIDTPGISLSNMGELDFIRGLARWRPETGRHVHLVVSALTKEGDLAGLLKRFRVAAFDDVVVTNLDQTTQHGILINMTTKMQKPFHSFGIGSDVVDGFEIASRERVLDLIFKLTKNIGDRGNDSRI
jgi:flagellar biosynthesis protein FlhF